MKNCFRRALIPLNPFTLIDTLISGSKLVFKKLPEDVTFIGTFYDYGKNCFYIAVESKEFECIEPGETLPILDYVIIEKSNLDFYVELIKKWAKEKGLLDFGIPYSQALKTLEEAEELVKAVKEGNMQEIKDGIGDVFVTLVVLCELLGLKLEDCVSYAYEQIKDRKGKIVNGQFVKEE